MRGFDIRVAVIQPWATRTKIKANAPLGDRPVRVYRQSFAKHRTAFAATMATGDTGENFAVTILAAAPDHKPIGTITLQLAKHIGAYVATTASAANTDWLRPLGSIR